MSKYITIPLARLSYPSLFTKKGFDESTPDDRKKYEATFLIEKSEKATIKKIKEAALKCAKDKWGKVPEKLVMSCLQDGSEKDDKDGYGDEVMFVPAAAKHRPQTVNRDKTPVTEEDNVLYAGCYVTGVISLYAWTFKNRKGISANLDVVQFRKDGEPFGAGKPDLDEVLPDLDDEDDDDMFGDEDE